MNKIILALVVVALSAGIASAKDRLILKIEGKDAKFNHKGHVKYTHGKCEVCHPAVPQAEECAIRFFWTVNPVLTGQQIRN